MLFINAGIAIGFTSARFTVREGVQASVCAVIRNGTIGRVVAFIIEALPIGTASRMLPYPVSLVMTMISQWLADKNREADYNMQHES